MQRKIFRIPLDETDSQEFIDIVNMIGTSIVEKEGTNEITIIKIKNWFDHKWLNYSGKIIIPFESGGIFGVDSALEPKWGDKITVPPFNPNRVLWEKVYFLNGQTISKPLAQLHTNKSSIQNLHNRIKDKSNKGLFVWYSSNSELNKKGSIMVYITDFGQVKSWYSSLEVRSVWKLNKTKGISNEEFERLLY